jgi:apolipoprotein N-acyltransferase
MRAWNTRASTLVVSLLAGCTHGLAFGASYAAALQLTAFALLGGIVFLLRARRQWGLLLLCCAAFWLASYTIGLRWIADALTSTDMLGFALGSLVYGMLVAGLSCLSILCLWAATIVSAPIRTDALCCACLSSALLAAELLREMLLPSFPWLSVGYAHVEGPFAALLSLVGVQGVSWVAQFVALWLGALAVSFATTRALRTTTMTLVAVIALGAVLFPRVIEKMATFTKEAGSLRVAVMQTAVSVREKFRASLFARHLTEIGDFARAHDGAQLILTPETAVPTTLRALTPAQQQFLSANVTASRALLFGAFAEDSRGDVFNSAVMLQRTTDGTAGVPAPAVQRTVYIKQHLAPIGEYAPPGFGWIATLLDLPMSNRRSTQDIVHNFSVSGITIIPSICQDLLYGDDLRTTTENPRLLVNLSNVAFFKNPLARAQFLNIARARALEQQVPVLIAANYGPTAFINAAGAVERELPADTPGALEVTVHPRTGTTLYARSGNWLLYLMMAAGATPAFASRSLRPLASRHPQRG